MFDGNEVDVLHVGMCRHERDIACSNILVMVLAWMPPQMPNV